ncbi:AAA family ATPase [Arthrobacter sp. CAN_A1]|uniref:AAA family ATPase n=1 Tax=Arthrobacter sp. CAN_A1 TaxID=2787717 RepID=UPI001A325A75
MVEEVSPHRFVDADIVLASLTGTEGWLVGIGGGDQRHHMTSSDMLQHSELYPSFPLSQPDYTNLPVGPDVQRQTVALGLHLFEYQGAAIAILQRKADPQYGRGSAVLEVVCADRSATRDFLAEFRRRVQKESILQGQILSFTIEEFGPSAAGVTFLRRPHPTEDNIILPEGLLDRVSEHALGIAAHRDALVAAGQHLKRGILLYGPPGTGKTHTVRYLLSASEGTTATLLSGGTLAHVSEAARMARILQPSIVVLEDCDLIAEDRSFGHTPQPLLFEVFDEMDGLDDDAHVTFVLTTNRVDMLERALAKPPGRVDLAVEIPLRSERERAGLLRLYAPEGTFSCDAIVSAAEETEGTTASFTKELVRRAVLTAAAAGVPVGDGHLQHAVTELMSDGATLTRSLLGSNGQPPGSGPESGGHGSFGYFPEVDHYSGSYMSPYLSTTQAPFDSPPPDPADEDRT